jgi:type III restriction enzyme
VNDVVIENPVLNSPYDEPRRHFRFDDAGITSEIVEGRRRSEYTVAVAGTRRRGRQLALQGQLAQERLEPNAFVNRIRDAVAMWRNGGYQGVTRTTRKLLEYWRDPERERRLFFCQLEAMETVIFINEVAPRYGQAWIENDLRRFAEEANPGLFRIAMKMATGSGKTVVMAMLIAWQVLNKVENPRDRRFSDAFLVVTPGITIRDRLRVLLPGEPDNYFDERHVVPDELRDRLAMAKIHIVNYHQFLPRQTLAAPRLTKLIASGGDPDAYRETPDDVARRVLRDLGAKRGIVVLNDEAHHCYRRRVDEEAIEEKLTGDERREAEQREKEARVWISGLEAIQQRAGIRVVYDLSATPFFLRGSGYTEGTLFQWVVCDFGLIDAIECGIVKVPRVPVDDDQMDLVPAYRELWSRIARGLPRKGRTTEAAAIEGGLPGELEGALYSLYRNYREYHERWEAGQSGESPPVFIVVCNNTNVSKLVYDWIAGYERELPDDETVAVPGKLDLFSNVQDERWVARPNTILVDSAQLESGESMSADFKRAAAREIEEFKGERRRRLGAGADEEIADEDLLREVMNTVGKPGRLGEQVKCVVSVSMLTEGWDANTVTHILGVRAFGTQLLCEQVVGRALRRISYVPGEDGLFPPEYAEVYGVPFSFIPTNGVVRERPPQAPPTLIRALPDREQWEIRFPNLSGYRYDLKREQLDVGWAKESRLTLTPRLLPTQTEMAPIIGESSIHTLDDLKELRPAQIEFALARLVMERYFRGEGQVEAWFFPQVLAITRRWIEECVDYEDHGFPQMLFISELAHLAAERIYGGIMRGHSGDAVLMPRLNDHNPEGSTRFVQLETRKETYRTKEKCHLSHVIVDSGWEAKLAQSLEEMPEVLRYAKNQGVNLRIPYTIGGIERDYITDFIAVLDDGRGPNDPLQLIIEVSGQERLDKEAKVETASTLWVPAVNNDGRYGRWTFLEITNPWSAQRDIRAFLDQRAQDAERVAKGAA